VQIVNAGEDWRFHLCRSKVQLMLVHFLVDLYSSGRSVVASTRARPV
jgi:hypothetical protein